jgi:hypothetical protein
VANDRVDEPGDTDAVQDVADETAASDHCRRGNRGAGNPRTRTGTPSLSLPSSAGSCPLESWPRRRLCHFFATVPWLAIRQNQK